jgi:hypothetical protein
MDPDTELSYHTGVPLTNCRWNRKTKGLALESNAAVAV